MNNTGVTKYASFALLGFVIGALVMFVAGKAFAPSEVEHTATTTPETVAIGDGTVIVPEGILTVALQSAGAQVVVTNVTLPEDGWLVVHEITDAHVGNALGAARRDAGFYDVVSIELLRNTLPQTEYAVVVYADNGNKIFEIKTDLPVINSTGDPVMSTFRTAVE